MPFSNVFIVSCRAVSILIILMLAWTFAIDSFSFRAIFVGLLFSHFAMGFYYSKGNIVQMKEKKFALLLASIILLIGLYFSIYVTYLAPFFLAIHVGLSDAYLLKIKAKRENDELLALLRTCFYTTWACVAFIKMPQLAVNSLLAIGFVCFVASMSISKDKTTLSFFELPLIAIVIYAQINQITYHVHYMGFYHIMTWYVFSFWMLFIKEKSPQKTFSFFSKVAALSVAFIFLFSEVFKLTITDQSFLKIIAIWSILHIFSSIPLSKFNPDFLKNLFYAR